MLLMVDLLKWRMNEPAGGRMGSGEESGDGSGDGPGDVWSRGICVRAGFFN